MANAVYFACDDAYMMDFGRTLIASCHHHDMVVECTLLGPPGTESVKFLTERGVRWNQTDILWNGDSIHFLQNYRFVEFVDVLRRHDGIFVTDVDGLFLEQVEWDLLNSSPVALSPTWSPALDFLDGHKAEGFYGLEGALYVRNDSDGRDFAERLGNFIKNKDGSGVLGIKRAMRDWMFGWSRSGTRTVHLMSNRYGVCNQITDAAIHLVPIGPLKYSPEFRKFQQKFFNEE